MATGTRSLTLKLLADVDNFTKNLKGADDNVKGFGDKVTDFGKKAGVAFAVAGAAAVAYAGKLAIDGVKAAIEDAAAQTKLAITLKNVTGATDAQIKATEDYITKTSLAFGVTDDDLRPSLERLSRATGNLKDAQELQTIAIDVAAGSGKSLESVTNAMARAAEGNTTALGKLGIGLSKAEISTMSLDQITARLADTFEGQAAAKADTFAGQMERLQIAFGEAKETVGIFILQAITPIVEAIVNKIMPALSNFINGIGGEKGLKRVFDDFVAIAKTIFIPIFDGIKSAFENIKDAVMDNKEEFILLFNFLKNYVAPFFGGAMKLAIEAIGIAISGVITLVGGLIRGFEKVIELSKSIGRGIGGIFSNSLFESTPSTVPAPTPSIASPFMPSMPTGMVQPRVQYVNQVTVNGAIDSESTARQIVSVLNESQARGTLGSSALFA
jgi:hypothetical protein